MSFIKDLFSKSKKDKLLTKYDREKQKLDSIIEQQTRQLYELDSNLSTYKNNFYHLSESDMLLYRKTLSSILDFVNNMARTVNTTTDIKTFVASYNALDKAFSVLEKHEFTGFFSNKPPSKNHQEILEKKHFTELDFLKRAYKIVSNNLLFGENAKYFYTFTEETIKYIRNGGKTVFDNNCKNNSICGEYDSLIFDAGRTIIERNWASIGLIQRTYKIGFNRSARIMEQLHELGVVSDELGTQPRKVVMNLSDFENLEKNFKGIFKDYPSISENTPSLFQSTELNERIKMYNNNFDYMEGHEFEHFCANLLKENDFENVEVTPGSGDQGVDIIAFKDGVKYGIQCKCYSSDIGNKAVQEAYSGARFYDCHVPVVLTNRYFTSSAKELAKKTGVLLWDRDKLEKMNK